LAIERPTIEHKVAGRASFREPTSSWRELETNIKIDRFIERNRKRELCLIYIKREVQIEHARVDIV